MPRRRSSPLSRATVQSGFSGDGGPATSARVNRPTDVAIHPSGHLIISDTYNARLRRVNATTGVITTIAGNGSCSSVNDGGLAVNASVCYPSGLSVSAAGDIFMGMFGRVRRIDGATAVITTVVGDGTGGGGGDGGPATSAHVGYVADVALDKSANLYLTDNSRNRTRRVDQIHQHNSDGRRRRDVTVDPRRRRRRCTPSASWSIRAVTSSLAIPARTASGVSTRSPASSRRSSATGRAGSRGTEGPRPAALLCNPQGLAFDAAGNLYIADVGNGRVRRVGAATGVITTVAGNGGTQSSGDGGPATSAGVVPQALAIGAAGYLYIADTSNHRIRGVDAGTGVIVTVAGNGTAGYAGDGGPATSASLASPRSVALDAGGNLYIADYDNYRVRKVDAVTGLITTVAGDGTYNWSDDGVPATGAGIGLTPSVAIDSGGHLLLGDGFSRVRRVDAGTGLISTVAGTGDWGFSGDGGPATAAQLTDVVAMSFSGTDVYFADASNYRVRRLGSSGVGPTSWTVPAAGGTTDVTVGRAGLTAWTAESQDDWLTVSVAGGTGSGTVTLTAEVNAGTTVRTGSVRSRDRSWPSRRCRICAKVAVDRTALAFGAVRAGSSFASQTGAQVIGLTERGALSVPWTVIIAEGVDVLVEKPLTADIAEARELVEAAAKQRVILQVGHLERFNPAIRRSRGSLRIPSSSSAIAWRRLSSVART